MQITNCIWKIFSKDKMYTNQMKIINFISDQIQMHIQIWKYRISKYKYKYVFHLNSEN